MIMVHQSHGICDFPYSDDVERAKKKGWKEFKKDGEEKGREKEVLKRGRKNGNGT